MASYPVSHSPQLSPASRPHPRTRRSFSIEHKPHNSRCCSEGFSGCPSGSGDRPKLLHPHDAPNVVGGPGMLLLFSSPHLALTRVPVKCLARRIPAQGLLPKGVMALASPQPDGSRRPCSPLDAQRLQQRPGCQCSGSVRGTQSVPATQLCLRPWGAFLLPGNVS